MLSSNLLFHAGGLYYTASNKLIRLNTSTGRKETKTSFPNKMRVSVDLPDILEGRPGRVIAVKERGGVAAFSTRNGELLWHQTVNLFSGAHFWYATIRSTLSKVSGSQAGLMKAMERDRRWWASLLSLSVRARRRIVGVVAGRILIAHGEPPPGGLGTAARAARRGHGWWNGRV